MQKETYINTINSYRKYYTPSKIFLTSKLLSNILYKYLLHNRIHGEVSERLKEHDWKSCVRLSRTQGSNPCLSAIVKAVLRHCFFIMFYLYMTNGYSTLIRIAFLYYMYFTILIMDFLCNITDDFRCCSAAATNNFSPRLTPYIYVVYKGS